MAVWGGRKPFLGTSPFDAVAPSGSGPPFLIDMACSVAARGKLKFAAQRREPIPEGLALDKNGRPPAEGVDQILIPGEPEALTESDRSENGIPLTPDVIASLAAEADLADISTDFT